MLYDLRTDAAGNDAIMIEHVTHDDDVIGDIILFTMNVDADYGPWTYAIFRNDDGTPIIYSAEDGAPSYSDPLHDVMGNDDHEPMPDDVVALATRLF